MRIRLFVAERDECEHGVIDLRLQRCRRMTRARRFLLVVGDSATLGEHPYYAAMIAAMDDLGAHGSAWADDADPLP